MVILISKLQQGEKVRIHVVGVDSETGLTIAFSVRGSWDPAER